MSKSIFKRLSYQIKTKEEAIEIIQRLQDECQRYNQAAELAIKSALLLLNSAAGYSNKTHENALTRQEDAEYDKGLEKLNQAKELMKDD